LDSRREATDIATKDHATQGEGHGGEAVLELEERVRRLDYIKNNRIYKVIDPPVRQKMKNGH